MHSLQSLDTHAINFNRTVLPPDVTALKYGCIWHGFAWRWLVAELDAIDILDLRHLLTCTCDCGDQVAVQMTAEMWAYVLRRSAC